MRKEELNQLEVFRNKIKNELANTWSLSPYRVGYKQALIDIENMILDMLLVPKQETLFTEEQVRDAIDMARSQSGYASYEFKENEIIQSLKQPKQ